MTIDIDRKFRVLADIIHAVIKEKVTIEDVKTSLSSSGDLKKTEIESITRLGKEFCFLEENQDGKLEATKSGLAFERYITAMNLMILKANGEVPKIDRETILRICATVPPMWKNKIHAALGEFMEDTLTAQKLVGEDTSTQLFVVTPYLDTGLIQVALKDVYAKNANLTIMTSEPSLAKTYPGGNNYKVQKLENLIKNRFKSGKVLFISPGTSIAHAKVWCSDKSVLVTSANVKPDSAADNLEVGIYTNDPELVATMQNFLYKILEMEGVKCLLEIPP